jgi:hypothetical protein
LEVRWLPRDNCKLPSQLKVALAITFEPLHHTVCSHCTNQKRRENEHDDDRVVVAIKSRISYVSARFPFCQVPTQKSILLERKVPTQIHSFRKKKNHHPFHHV